jgi:hypothetical protein
MAKSFSVNTNSPISPSSNVPSIVTKWRRSSFCNANGCVEVNIRPAAVFVRNSKDETRYLAFTHEDWAAFLAGVRNGEFDLPT